jgi:acylphosphatase
LIRAHVLIFGRVQGVFFRANTLERAIDIGLRGWVRNVHSGEVEAVFEGDEEKIKEMIEWCKKGPPGARVDKIETKFYEYKGEFEDFKRL